ncbi:hypothetical protein GDO78_007239 [Eleutherodactylus coqui]|uniref:Uncharacterized protein n=1 Tax=Eleutherodactylus coqui TaxID=57060 RepID=A0A8J6KD38_ELECQ|nr:hypothetical protein GDO78_007239 [Eleutherodactylus coqui]
MSTNGTYQTCLYVYLSIINKCYFCAGYWLINDIAFSVPKDSSVSSRKTTDKSNTDNTASLNTKDMSEMVHRFKTMNVTERPSALLESVPEIRYPKMQSQPKGEHPKPLPQGYPQGAVV